MDLDDDDYELLGWGSQREYERTAKGLASKQAARSAYMLEYMRVWRRMNPDKVKYYVKNKSETAKLNDKARKKLYYIKHCEELKEKAKQRHKRRKEKRKQRGTKTTTTTKTDNT